MKTRLLLIIVAVGGFLSGCATKFPESACGVVEGACRSPNEVRVYIEEHQGAKRYFHGLLIR